MLAGQGGVTSLMAPRRRAVRGATAQGSPLSSMRVVSGIHPPSDNGCSVYDRSASFGVLELTGEDRAAFLQGQCTNSIVGQPAGAAVEACVLTAQGRVVDLITVCVGFDCLRVVASAPRVQTLASLFEKHIFPMDRVSLDVKDLAVFSLLGPDTLKAAELALANVLIDSGDGSGVDALKTMELDAESLEAAGITMVPGSGLAGAAKATNGATLLVPKPLASAVWRVLSSAPSVSFATADPGAWTAARVSAGRPEADAEFEAALHFPPTQPSSPTKEGDEPAVADKPKMKKNAGCLPLELGLFHTVDFNKGCYMGQETVAKVAKQDAVRRELWGLAWDDAKKEKEDLRSHGIAAGSRVYLLPDADSNDSKDILVGTVTSVAPAINAAAGTPSSGARALALMKRSSAHEGQRVRVLQPPLEQRGNGDELASASPSVGPGWVARLVDLPYSSRSLLEAASPPVQPSVAAVSSTSEPQKRSTAAIPGVDQSGTNTAAADAAADAAAGDAERKRAKIAAMEAKLAAFKQKKSGPASPASSNPSPNAASAVEASEEDAKASEAARKAAKLAANKAKLDAMNARKKGQQS